MDDEGASLLRRLDRLARGRDYYLSFPARFAAEGIEPAFFSRFMVLGVERQKYPAFFQLVRRLRSRLVALPDDTISERVGDELGRGRLPVLLMPAEVSPGRFERVGGLNVCTLEVAFDEFERMALDPFMGDLFPDAVAGAVRRRAQAYAASRRSSLSAKRS